MKWLNRIINIKKIKKNFKGIKVLKDRENKDAIIFILKPPIASFIPMPKELLEDKDFDVLNDIKVQSEYQFRNYYLNKFAKIYNFKHLVDLEIYLRKRK